ncbi:MAG: ABC transporter permease [Opitutaceae bacterium]|nr:ABC transporter permease [Verrucomicrobiales bacterium]
MTIRDQFSTALSNLGRRKVRTALASLGVVVGTLTIVVMISLASGVRQQINQQFASLGLDRMTVRPGGEWPGGFGPPGSSRRTKIITPEDVARWRGWSGVTKVTPEVNLPGSVRLDLNWDGKTQPVNVSGGESRPGPGMTFTFTSRPEPVAGSLDLPDQGGIILSRGTAQALNVASNDFAGLLNKQVEVILRSPRGETQSFALRIQGLSPERSSTVQISPADRIAMKSWWFNSTNLLQKEGYDLVTIRAADASQAHALIPRLKKEGLSVQSLEMFVEVANRVVIAITVLLAMIGSVALLVASIGIANTMVMSIYERTREIGILKAIGASRGEIRGMFMMEAGFIGLIGGVFGLFFGWLLGAGLNQAIAWYFQYRDMPVRGNFFVVTWLLALGVIAFASLIGLLAGLLPAQRAASLDPLAALRHE